jgi:hypothetical protein
MKLIYFLAAIMLVGCTPRKQVDSMRIDFSTGCHFAASGFTVKEAEDLKSMWQFEHDPETGRCIIKVENTDTKPTKEATK